MYNVLVVDDDKEIVSAIEIYLRKENYNVLKAYDGEETLKILNDKSNEIHLVILDIMMPKKDGIQTLKELRMKFNLPVLVLSAKSEDNDKIEGLNIGADDYLTKPFNNLELIARVKSLLRRYTVLGAVSKDQIDNNNNNTYIVGDLSINDDTKEVICEGKSVKLTPTEYNILKFLVKNKGKVFSISQIYENVWEEESFGTDNIIAVHIRHIREKIEINPKEPRYIKVVWGQGYKMEDLKK